MTASNQTQQTPPVADLPEDMRAAIDRFSDAAYQCGAFRGGSYATWRAEAGEEYDAALAAMTALLASHQRLAEALTSAKNILYLLTPEVSALGMRAYLIHEKIDAALASIPKEPT